MYFKKKKNGGHYTRWPSRESLRFCHKRIGRPCIPVATIIICTRMTLLDKTRGEAVTSAAFLYPSVTDVDFFLGGSPQFSQ